MNEKRKATRKYLYNYSKIFDRQSNKLTGRIVNITEAGMMVMCEKPIKPDSSFKFRMVLPGGINAPQGEAIDFDGSCRWCKNSYNPDYYDAGFEFTRIPEPSKDAIEFLMRYHSFNY